MSSNQKSTIHQPATDHPTEPASDVFGMLHQIHPVELHVGLIEVNKTKFTIGRDASCDFCIPRSPVSRKHAEIQRIDGEIFITDLGSTNGTWVNQRQIQSTKLNCGDRIQIGSMLFKFLQPNDIEVTYFESVYGMMTRDGMTNAYNKRYFLDMLSREVKRRQRNKAPLSLLMIDVDEFKALNDTHGHPAGDEVLIQIVRRLTSTIREEDVVARFGGEEFALLLCETSTEEAVHVAERCRQNIESAPFLTREGEIEMTISVGVATVDELNPFLGSEALISLADQNLYLAKNRGRNQVCFESPVHEPFSL